MKPLNEAEKQLLIAVSALASRNGATDPQTIAAFAQDYFGMYFEITQATYGSLLSRRFLASAGDGYRLTPEARALAEAYRQENPRHRYFYDEYFTRVEHSRAHAAFCERVYGRNLAQHGMMDMEQLAKLLQVLALAGKSAVLELGCGNGMVAEHISDVTLAHVTGVDTSAVGIRQANARTEGKRPRLRFIRGDMQSVEFPAAAFDTVIAIDSLYYVGDMARFLQRLRAMIRPGGQIGVLHSAWIMPDQARERLLADGTALGQALCQLGLTYEALDLTGQEIAHWRKKLSAIRELRQDLEEEGNLFLYQRRALEAELHQPYVEARNVSRYLYHVRL